MPVKKNSALLEKKTSSSESKSASIPVVENENEMKSPLKPSKKPIIDVTPTTKAVTPKEVKISPHTTSIEKKVSNRKSPGAAVPPTKIILQPETELVYKSVRKSSGTLGGNGYDGAMYGELTMHSMQKVINFLKEHCELTSTSRFIDIGSGLGKPNFHAAQDPQVRISLGIELEDIRWQLAMYNLHESLKLTTDETTPEINHDVAKNIYGGINFIGGDVDRASSTDPFTHIYQFDLGFPPDLQSNIALKFNNSCHAKYLVSYRPPLRVIEEYGYMVVLVDQLLTSMHGSGEGHTAYVYKRTNEPAKITDAHTKLTIPGRARLQEADVEVVCDPLFVDTIKLAIGPLDELKTYAGGVIKKQLTAERPKRERKPVLRK